MSNAGTRRLPELDVDEETSRRLGRVRQSGTGAELAARRAAHAAGLRFRVNNPDLPGRPDIANRRRRWAIFIHGCFWHRHRGCKRATTPKRNRSFWLAKFRANSVRDRRVVRSLAALGYSVLVLWECEVLNPDQLALLVSRFAQSLAKRVS